MKKYPNLTSAEIIADSISPKGHRMTTIKMVFPRYILAELNTHRMFNRNSASSRAIPFRKMVQSAMNNPFIPIAFQKDHTGMQGSEYLDPELPVNIGSFSSILKNVFKYSYNEIEEMEEEDDYDNIAEMVVDLLGLPLKDGDDYRKTPAEWWLWCRDRAVESATIMASIGVTKQIANRILEPFIYHTALITATEWENFFELRCPKYEYYFDHSAIPDYFKSKKDLINQASYRKDEDDMYWLSLNKGAGEIHIMDLAEKVWDAMNESTPKILSYREGHILSYREGHIPFMDKETEQGIMDITPKPSMGHPEEDSEPAYHSWLDDVYENMLKVSVARAARISYETLGDNPVIDYEKDIKLHDDLLAMKHMSPFEHIGHAMDDDEFLSHIRTSEANANYEDTGVHAEADGSIRNMVYLSGNASIPESDFGWSRNLHGFIQYREIVEQNK